MFFLILWQISKTVFRYFSHLILSFFNFDSFKVDDFEVWVYIVYEAEDLSVGKKISRIIPFHMRFGQKEKGKRKVGLS